MEQNIIIYIGTWKLLSMIATVVAGTWYAAYRLGRVETRMVMLETRMVTLETRVSVLDGRVDNLYAGQSPIALSPKGLEILEKSGLKRWIDKNSKNLLGQVKTPTENLYDIQAAAFALFDSISFPQELEAQLKNAAFQGGTNMDNVRRIGGIYFCDICLKARKLGQVS